MATLKATIMLNDMMSQQFRAMNMAMATVIDSFQTLQNTSSKAVNVSALEAAHRELQQVEASFNQIEQEIRQAEQAQKKLNQNIQQGDNIAKKLLGTIGTIAGTYLTLQAAGDVISLSDEMTNITARLDLMNDGLQTTEELQQMIFNAAQRSLSSYADVADMVGKLGNNARDAFGSTAEVVAFAELIQKQFSIAGAGAVEAANASLQLTQALASGVLRGDELNSIFEQAPNLIQTIADYLEVPIGEIREMAAEGEITAGIVKAAMFDAADDINEKFNSMPLTFGDLWTTFKNEALWAFKDVLGELNNIANSEKFRSFVDDLRQSLYTLANVATKTIQIMAAIGGFVYDNWSLIAPVIGTATTAIGLLTAAIIANRIATGISIAYQTAKAIAIAVTTGATIAQTAATHNLTVAQWALNSAMLASPITWIIAAIVILIGIIYLAVAAINHFAGTSISATGIIAGAFAVLGAFIYNQIAFWWNLFAAIAEFFANVWKHPVYSVKRLFANLANSAIDMATSMIGSFDSAATNLANLFISGANMAVSAINWVIDALNNIPGINIEKIGQFSKRTSIVGDFSGLKSKINDWVGEAPADYWEAPKWDMISLGDAWNTGYKWGENLFSSFNQHDPNQELKDAFAGLEGIKDAIEEGNEAGKDTAGNTKKLADSADLLEEDLKYLRDLAEREAINRYTTAEIKVDMKNENYINSEMDIDGIIDRFGERAEEVAEMLAEGGAYDV